MPYFKVWNPEKHIHLSKDHKEFNYRDGASWLLWDNAEDAGCVSSTLFLHSEEETVLNAIKQVVEYEWDGEPIISPPLYTAVMVNVDMYGDVESANTDGAFHDIPGYFEGTASDRALINSIMSGTLKCVGLDTKLYSVFWFDGEHRYTKDKVIDENTVWLDITNPQE